MDKEKIVSGVEEIFNSLARSAKSRFKDRYEAAKAELKKFEEKIKKDLIRFTEAAANGELTKKQFKQLVSDNVRLAEMKGLTQAGITLVEIDKFQNAAIKKIVGIVFKVILAAAV